MSNRFFPNYTSYIVTSPFGMRTHPVTREPMTMHNGIDLVATADGKTGQADKIMAHTGGIVDGVGYDKDAGNYIRIKVDQDTKMYYFHLRDMSTLTAGEVVKAGQIIGIMGQTGRVTARHLHWGIKYKGQWIDPAPYLDADYAVTKTYGTVTYKYLRIRNGAGTNYTEVGRLKKGDRVEILETKAAGGATWGRIDQGWICLTGYVKLETVTECPEVPNEPDTPEKEETTFTVTCRVLSRGCKGKDVESLQAMLVGLGYNLGDTGPKKNGVDGSYGSKTENGVECFQEDTNGILKPDGVFGSKSQAYSYGIQGGN